MSLVEIDGATLRYGALTALSGLDLRLEPGEVLGLLGHNGAGKTTTIKLVLGLLAPSEGRVRVLGHDARSLEARRQLGYLPENVTFYPQLSGAETLRHFARLKGVAPAEAARLLEQVGLGHAARRRLKTYSKGMRQRLGLAQALLGEPRLLLLDEPTVGLDPLATVELYQLLDRLRGQGTGIVLCSHVLPGVETHIDRAAILAGGRLQVAGSLAELRRKAALPTRVRLASPHNPQWLERWHRAGLAARRLDGQRIEVLLDDAERDGVLEALLAAREFDLETAVAGGPLSPPHVPRPRRSHTMPVVWTIARKELADGLRNRWLLAISLLFALLSVGIAWFGAAAAGQVGFTSVPATVASLTSLATFLMPLIALLLAYDAIVGEEEGGTLLLLLTYPLGRGQLLLGKFLGHGLILALATLIGFGSAALAILALVPEVEAAILLGAFGRFMGSSLLLGCVFLALAYALSSRASEKSSAAGQALGLWFFFVLLFDLALLAILVLSQGHLSPRLLPWLLLLNPTDLYRLINLSGFDAAAAGGVVPLASDLPVSASALWLALALWACAALALAHGLFRRRPI